MVCFELEALISVFIMHNKECFLNFEAAHNAFETGILASCRLLMTTLGAFSGISLHHSLTSIKEKPRD
jgi:hypothetical protein